MERFYDWGNSQEAVEILETAFINIEKYNIINIFRIGDKELQNEVSAFMNSVDINKVPLETIGEIYIKTSVAMLRLARKEDSIESLINTFDKTGNSFFYGLIENFEKDLISIDKKLNFWNEIIINFIPILKSSEEIYEYIDEIACNISNWAFNKISAGNTGNYTYNDLWNLNMLTDTYIDDVIRYIEIEEQDLFETFEIEKDDMKDIENLLTEDSNTYKNGALLIKIYLYMKAAYDFYKDKEEYEYLVFYQKYISKVEEHLVTNNDILSEALTFCDGVLAWEGFIDATSEILKKYNEEDLVKIDSIKSYIDDLMEKLPEV